MARAENKWRQVGGDMSWDRHGVVLAKNDPAAREVAIVQIVPWIEHDKEAAVTHGLYLVDQDIVDHADLDVGEPVVGDAIRSVGMTSAEYEALPAEDRAAVLKSHAGFDDSRSENRLADALPAPPEQIEFWGGRESSDKLASYDADIRREALEANFDTRMTFGQMPDPEALAFALGDEPLEISLQGQDALAFEYATVVEGDPGLTDTPEAITATVAVLVAAPSPADLDPEEFDARLGEILDEWEQRYGDPADEESGIAAAAGSLASSIMASLGFEWI